MPRRVGENHRITTDEDDITVDVLDGDFNANTPADNQSENENPDTFPDDVSSAGEVDYSPDVSSGDKADTSSEGSSGDEGVEADGDTSDNEFDTLDGNASVKEDSEETSVVVSTEQNTKQLKESPKKNQKPPKSDKETKKTAGVLILKKAATYFGCGLKFSKNIPTTVSNKAIYDKLLATGLFVEG